MALSIKNLKISGQQFKKKINDSQRLNIQKYCYTGTKISTKFLDNKFFSKVIDSQCTKIQK